MDQQRKHKAVCRTVLYNNKMAYIQSESVCHVDFVMVLDLALFNTVMNLMGDEIEIYIAYQFCR